jgi:hypothetical protein
MRARAAPRPKARVEPDSAIKQSARTGATKRKNPANGRALPFLSPDSSETDVSIHLSVGHARTRRFNGKQGGDPVAINPIAAVSSPARRGGTHLRDDEDDDHRDAEEELD